MVSDAMVDVNRAIDLLVRLQVIEVSFCGLFDF